jgi:hypothetical protein
MKTLKVTIAAIGLAAVGGIAAMAQNTESPGTSQNPPAMAPSTTTPPSGQGSSAGESGVNSPAGIPADPTTNQNVQPGPSTNTPNDPAAGSNPGARVPTSPPGTGSSSP